MFGGNSNWRGPVWFPVNYLVLRALLHLYSYYGDDFTVECPTGSGRQCTLFEVAIELGRRLTSIFVPDADGRRPVYGGTERFQTDPNWKDLLQFHEYFHGDNGAGLGASHQTGWTGLVARVIQVRGLPPTGGSALDRAPREPRVPRSGIVSRVASDSVIYELNTAAWLHDVGGAPERPRRSPTSRRDEWDQVTPPGVDAVWLMGVWERSPAGVQLALESADQVASFHAALPDLDDTDVIGSAYCIRRYEVDARFGGREGLAVARAALAERGVRLSSTSCPTTSLPITRGSSITPSTSSRAAPTISLATQRAFSRWATRSSPAAATPTSRRGRTSPSSTGSPPGLRQAAADTLLDIADQADGVRCDMAMLLLNDVFARDVGRTRRRPCRSRSTGPR